MMPPLYIRRLPHAAGLPLPSYATEGSAGMDLMAADDYVIPPTDRQVVATGLCMHIPAGYEGQVRSRSGLAKGQGVAVLNSPGTIDSDYRGEVKVLLINHGAEPAIISRGDRIAQLVIAPVEQVMPIEVADLDVTARGDGGFGSTGR